MREVLVGLIGWQDVFHAGIALVGHQHDEVFQSQAFQQAVRGAVRNVAVYAHGLQDGDLLIRAPGRGQMVQQPFFGRADLAVFRRDANFLNKGEELEIVIRIQSFFQHEKIPLGWLRCRYPEEPAGTGLRGGSAPCRVSGLFTEIIINDKNDKNYKNVYFQGEINFLSDVDLKVIPLGLFSSFAVPLRIPTSPRHKSKKIINCC